MTALIFHDLPERVWTTCWLCPACLFDPPHRQARRFGQPVLWSRRRRRAFIILCWDGPVSFWGQRSSVWWKVLPFLSLQMQSRCEQRLRKKKKQHIQLSDQCLSLCCITTPEDSNPPPSDQGPERCRNVKVWSKMEEVGRASSIQKPATDGGRDKLWQNTEIKAIATKSSMYKKRICSNKQKLLVLCRRVPAPFHRLDCMTVLFRTKKGKEFATPQDV